MKKKILIAILAVIVVAFISGCFIFRDEIGKVRHNIYPINKNLEEKNTKEDIKEASKMKEKETSTQTVQKSKNETSTQSVSKSKDSSTNTTSDNKNNNSSNKVNNSSNTKHENKSSNQESTINSNNNNAKQEEKPVVVQKQPWEELGLTEDQYKNQPMYSWEEVDFKTKDECMNYGNEHAEYGFECSEVTSWTRSLGWDYKTF